MIRADGSVAAGWELAVEHLPSISEALGSNPSS